MIEWWTQQQGTWIGAIGGSSLGVLGGLLGTCIGVFATRGMLKTPVVGLQAIMAAACLVLLLLGAYANVTGQPHHVYYILMLAGSTGMGVSWGLLPMTLWCYRMAAARAGDGKSFHAVPSPTPPSSMTHSMVEAWGPEGSLRRLSRRLGAVLGVVTIACLAGIAVSAVTGSPTRAVLAWMMAATGPAIGAAVCLSLPKMLLRGANKAQDMLDQQRLAAEELRRT